MDNPGNAFANDFLCNVNPYIRLAWYDTLAPGHVIAERVIYDYEIVFIKSGFAIITVENEQFDAKCGDIFFFKPGQRHSFAVRNENLIQPHIHFDMFYQSGFSSNVPISFKNITDMCPHEKGMIQNDVTNQFFDSFPTFIRLNNPTLVEQLLFDVINAYDMPTVFPEIRLKWTFLRLLDHLLCEVSWQTAKHGFQKNEWAKLFKLYLEHNTDRQVTLDELAQVYHIDKSYISRLFAETYGISPIRYHVLIRISKAKNMIMYTNLSLTSIASQTGFSSLQDFSRVFRRMEGKAPSSLRS